MTETSGINMGRFDTSGDGKITPQDVNTRFVDNFVGLEESQTTQAWNQFSPEVQRALAKVLIDRMAPPARNKSLESAHKEPEMDGWEIVGAAQKSLAALPASQTVVTQLLGAIEGEYKNPWITSDYVALLGNQGNKNQWFRPSIIEAFQKRVLPGTAPALYTPEQAMNNTLAEWGVEGYTAVIGD